MASPRHIIHKQQLDLNFRGGVADMGIHAALSSWIYGKLLPAIEEVFNEVAPAGKHIRLQNLELDAGDISGPGWEEDLVLAICSKLRAELTAAATVPDADDSEIPPGKRAPGSPSPGQERFTVAGSSLSVYTESERLNLLMQYLQTGSVPWYASGLQATELLHWLEEAVESHYFSSTEGIRFLTGGPGALERLLMQSRPLTLERWFHQWDAVRFREWLPAFLLLARPFRGHGHAALVWSYALLFAGITGNDEAASDLLLELRTRNDQGERGEYARLASATRDLLGGQVTIEGWSAAADKFKAASLGNGSGKREQESTERPDGPGEAAHPLHGPEAGNNAEYFIGNAGIVLLHPFLAAWFTALELYSEAGWVSDDARRRAVLLLHYAATGMEAAAEYELPLCKLLTGYPMDRPVEARLDLRAEEREETKALLSHVIAQWPILKTTSPEGLQQSFLAREGKLSLKDNGRLLQVAQKSYDLLLDHLPWGFSVIRNSWMQEILFTEWI